MSDLTSVVDGFCRLAASWVPYPALHQYSYLQRAFVALLLIGPLCSTIGIQVVNFRLSFFAEAIGHSAFTGIALGVLAGFAADRLGGLGGLDTNWLATIVMTIFGVGIALIITLFRRHSNLSSDTVIGVFAASIMAFGLTVLTGLQQVSASGHAAFTSLQTLLLGNILTIDQVEVAVLAGFFVVAMAFQVFAFNRLLFIGIHADLAQTRGIAVAAYEYFFACLLALVILFSIKAIGVLLVTAMLVIPAAAARNFARSAAGLFWWGLLISTSSCLGGLLLSDQWNTAAGSTAVLCTAAWFTLSSVVSLVRHS